VSSCPGGKWPFDRLKLTGSYTHYLLSRYEAVRLAYRLCADLSVSYNFRNKQ
jgi:hypothetical protein